MKNWKVWGILALLALLCAELVYLSMHPELLERPAPPPEAAETPEPPAAPSPTPSPTPSPSPTPTPLPLPDSEDMWQLAIASVYYPLEGEYEVETAAVGSGYLFDARAAGALNDMIAAARADGMGINITSAWRSHATQAQLYENRVYRFQLEGYSREEAEEIGATVVARPGTSEHELGLSVDFITDSYHILDEGFAEQPEYDWLIEHCAEYGFIQRYPLGKSELTGIIWEPWHYRYVGRECAEYIMEHGLCLEEFLLEAGLIEPHEDVREPASDIEEGE